MPDKPEVPEYPETKHERLTFFVPEANIDLSGKGMRIALDEDQLADLSDMMDQNSGTSPGCISAPGGPSC
ncbi:hypothetical protein ACFVUY_40010 [Kitasatospora sp. NPDC058063]|uniref:hypothetical protein n=1 Tax=unclassified Kitasatospora TaxID=2633591 RepID=UPI0036DE374D